MAFQEAVIIGLLGTAFFLVYASSKLDGDKFFMSIFKIFLMVSAFAVILFVAPYSFMITPVNDNSTTVTSYGALRTAIGTQIYIVDSIFIFFIVLFICYILYLCYKAIVGYRERKRSGGDGDD